MLSDAPGERTMSSLGQKGTGHKEEKAGANISRKLTREGSNVSTLIAVRGAGRYQSWLHQSLNSRPACLSSLLSHSICITYLCLGISCSATA